MKKLIQFICLLVLLTRNFWNCAVFCGRDFQEGELGNASVIIWASDSTEFCVVNPDPLKLCVWVVG